MALESFELSGFLPYRLAALSERVSRRLSVEYSREHGLTVAEWRVLVHLLRRDEISVRDIQGFVNMEKPRVSRAVSRLAEAGFVEKRGHERDNRLISVRLTQEGRALLERILPAALEYEARLQAALTDEELEAFYRTIDKLHAALDTDPEAPPHSGYSQLP